MENEMNVFCNVLNICLLYNNFNLYNDQWFYTHFWLCNFDLYLHLYSFNLISTNSICGFIPKGCILNISSSIARIISTYPCSWIFCGSFSSWPLPLRTCGFSICSYVVWVVPLLRSYGSLVCTSSSWAIPLGLVLVSSS